MRSEKTKMLAGDLYDASDAELSVDRLKARALCQQFNALAAGADAERTQVLNALFGRPVSVNLTAPFFCDYGYNIELGRNVYFNFNCVILDVAVVSIGSNTLVGPGVHIYAAAHPMTVAERRGGLELGKPVSIGNDVWIGGGCIVNPGVKIGHGSVIGSGSVVTRDIPSGVFAAGNPCRVIRSLLPGSCDDA
jgi:maltose O-acetyltransferase